MRKQVANLPSEQIKLIDPNKPVRVYRNLHTGLWSVKQGVVRFHTEIIYLHSVQFVVNEKHRQRVISEKRKNVHAYVVGYLSTSCRHYTSDNSVCVCYNPYKYDSFMCERGKVSAAEFCMLVKQPTGKMAVIASHPLTSEQGSGIISTVATHLL